MPAFLLFLLLVPSCLQAADFTVGVNYPWHSYGWDFGENAWGHRGVSDPRIRAEVAGEFADMRNKGVTTVRWWVFGDGRASPDFGPEGKVAALDASFFPDIDAALAIAQENGIKVILVLFDSKVFKPAVTDKGVQEGGRASLFTDSAVQDSFFDAALLPLLRRYGRHPAILAWEVMNEPELGMKAGGVKQKQLHAFAKRVAAAIHAETSQLATLGAWKRRHLKSWQGAGLDFYQFHHYEDDPLDPLDAPISKLKLDKPVWLGEFPSKNGPRGLTEYLDTAARTGLSGALFWSYRSRDGQSDFSGAAAVFTAWTKKPRP